MAECLSCGAEIIWAVTENGKHMPLDAEPSEASPHGLMTLTDENDEVLARVVKGDLYRSHFATCPNASQHRRRS